MKKFILLLFSLFFFASCTENVQKPEHLLDKEVMENILYDISILQATQSFKQKSLSEKNIIPSVYIYEKYNIDSTTYIQNYKYYASDIKSFKKMYKRVDEKIQQNKAEIDSASIKGKKKFEEAVKANVPVID